MAKEIGCVIYEGESLKELLDLAKNNNISISDFTFWCGSEGGRVNYVSFKAIIKNITSE